jgi:hypothetical protein
LREVEAVQIGERREVGVPIRAGLSGYDGISNSIESKEFWTDGTD